MTPPVLKDFEMRFLDLLCDPCRSAVDVGGNVGSYSELLAGRCKHLYVYEPLPGLGRALRRRYMGRRDVTVRTVALSDRKGANVLSTPRYTDPDAGRDSFVSGWSSLRKSYDDLRERYPERFTEVRRTVVRTVRLDDEPVEDVGFMKIDVEGFELEVLKGAARTIARDQPVLLVEMEERHRRGCVGTISRRLARAGYRGYFFLEGRLHPLSRFSVERMQRGKTFPGRLDADHSPHYIFNFIFLPARSRGAMVRQLKRRQEELAG